MFGMMKHRDFGRLAESSQNDWACTRISTLRNVVVLYTLPQWLNEIDNMLDQILGLFEKMLPLICSDLSLCFPFKPLLFEGVICVIHSCACHAFGWSRKKGWDEQRSEPRQSQKAVRFGAARARQTHSVAGWFQICYMWVKHGKTIINHPFGNGLYHLIIYGDLGHGLWHCFTHILCPTASVVFSQNRMLISSFKHPITEWK